MAFAIGGNGGRPVFNALRELARGSVRLSVAVSYVQLSGWELLWQAMPRQSRGHLRILCTDQLGITDPKAIRAILDEGVQLRAFKPNRVVFHPKVFIGHRVDGPDLYLLGSANLSRSALLSSVEVDQSGEDTNGTLGRWFDAQFSNPNKAVKFDEERLRALEAAFAARMKSGLVFQRAIAAVRRQDASVEANASATIESIFAGLTPTVAPLNFDKAGNNVRRLGIIQLALQGRIPLRGKTLSEMKLLGFAEEGQLNPLGRRAAAERSLEGVARIWMTWLKNASRTELALASPSGQLERARAAFQAFWTMKNEITEYFIQHSEAPTAQQKRTHQTIELLANSGRRLSDLSLDDVSTLSRILDNTKDLPPAAAEAVRDYLANKGARGWPYPDRRIAVIAWRDA